MNVMTLAVQYMNIYERGDFVPALEIIAVVAKETTTTALEVGGKVVEVTAEEAKEIAAKGIETAEKTKDVVVEKLSDIKSMSPEQLREQMEKNLSETDTNISAETDENTQTKEGITDEQKQCIREETGWSDKIIDDIGSWKEYEIYKNAGLVEAEIGGKKCLIRNDIDWNKKDAFGRTNKERAEQGLSPLNKDGKLIELHHIGQHADSPLAELTWEEHRGKGNDGILHNKNVNSEIDRTAFANERSQHWQARVNEGGA